jgi:hypothetical protein
MVLSMPAEKPVGEDNKLYFEAPLNGRTKNRL